MMCGAIVGIRQTVKDGNHCTGELASHGYSSLSLYLCNSF